MANNFNTFKNMIERSKLETFDKVLKEIFGTGREKDSEFRFLNFKEGLEILKIAYNHAIKIYKYEKKLKKDLADFKKIHGNPTKYENFTELIDYLQSYAFYLYGVVTHYERLTGEKIEPIYTDLDNLSKYEVSSKDFFAPLEKGGSLYELNNELNFDQGAQDYRKSPHAQMCSVLGLNNSQSLIELAVDFQTYFNILQELKEKIELSNINKEDDKDCIIFKKTVKLIKNECLNEKNKDFLLSYKKAAKNPIKELRRIVNKYLIT